MFAALILSAVLGGVGAMLLWYAASDSLPRSTSTALLESIMPLYDVQEVHATHVAAPASVAYAAILSVTPGEMALARPFFWVRSLPSRIAGGKAMDDAMWSRPFLSPTSPAVIGQAREREIVAGLIGRFWELGKAERVPVRGREQFVTFDAPGFAVATLSFHLDPEDGGTRVTTITRVRTTDPDSRRAFLRYWRVIGTGSAILRRTWLRAVKERAETSALRPPVQPGRE